MIWMQALWFILISALRVPALLVPDHAESYVGQEKTQSDTNTFYADDWPGMCAEGMQQSPIHFAEGLTYRDLPDRLHASVNLPRVHNMTVKNTGHGLQVEWPIMMKKWQAARSIPVVPAGGSGIAAALLGNGLHPTKTLSLVPVQMHFHTASEHMVQGMFHAAELHIVTLVAKGAAPEWGCDDVWLGGKANFDACAAVFATMFNIGSQSFEDALINAFLDVMPWSAGASAAVPVPKAVDLSRFLPAQRSSYLYFGSLTTPGCNEGVRWLVHQQPLIITPATLSRLYSTTANTTVEGARQIYRTNNRLVQPVNSRPIWLSRSSDSVGHHAPVGSFSVDSIVGESLNFGRLAGPNHDNSK